jgi:SAM-dependent methyltransferase
MQPHGPEFFRGKRVLDAGCGNGRFAYYAAKYGAEVWAIDLGPAVEVTRRNTEHAGIVQVVQADLHRPPFEPESFDFIYSTGCYTIYPIRFESPAAFEARRRNSDFLYWSPEGQPIKRRCWQWSRRAKITTRLPHTLVYALAFPAAAAAFAFFIWPYRLLKKIPGLRSQAEKIPMKQYSNFPFRVCVNDQLDRFSAPIENRYTAADVAGWLSRAKLEQTKINPAYGWVGTGRKPVTPALSRQ